MRTYVDTSALGRLLLVSPETVALREWLDATVDDLVAVDLAETELRRVAVREGINQLEVTHILDGISLAEMDRAMFREAGLLLAPFLRTLDALHLQGAIRLDADAVLTYDTRMSDAARGLGFAVHAPGAATGDL